ncbi:sugar kinase [Nocardia otitidiscaviarum]|uniref:PfkB family carbohydrate kinase n=1 Tax=Nocardia otitidiscaviarum TaxID=1823 RepID=UPI0004A74B25|nr:PfkB family carbohydrate kinase [Nocardia otitidiscaviarum]MBF6134281.1 sugar kinase [Nocardia otitidiscaviarum]MBF6484056.1 sugar kinase [Nocardia otitidiscaviarum]
MGSGAAFVGLSTLDIAYAVQRYPDEDTKVRADGMFLGAGGPAANAAVAYAGLSGQLSTLITALGKHVLAEPIRADLRAHGVTVVDTAPERAQRPPVSSIVVAAGAGSRTIVSMDGSEQRDPLPAPDAAHWADAAVVLVDGHYPELALHTAASARRHGIPVVLDAGRWRDVHHELLPLVDIAICAAAFTPPHTAPGTDAVLDRLLALGPRAVAVSRGARPIRYATAAGRGEIPVRAERVVDTLGAGDILHGAFCHFHSVESDFVTALRRAADIATLSCRYPGTREWLRHLPAQSTR